MSDNTLSIRIIFGSARNPRFCDVIGKWLLERLEARPGLELAVIDPRELDLPQDHAPERAAVRSFGKASMAPMPSSSSHRNITAVTPAR